MDRNFFEWLIRTVLKDTTSDIDYYVNGAGGNSGEYANLFTLAIQRTAPGSAERKKLIDYAYTNKIITSADTAAARSYWINTSAADLGGDVQNFANAAETYYTNLAATQPAATPSTTPGTAPAPAPAPAAPSVPGTNADNRTFFTWLIRDVLGDQTSDINYYLSAASVNQGEYANLFTQGLLATAAGSVERKALIDYAYANGIITSADTPTARSYWYDTDPQGFGEDATNFGIAAEKYYMDEETGIPAQTGGGPPSTGDGSDIPPIPGGGEPGTDKINNVSIPRGMRLIRVTSDSGGNVPGTDSTEVFYLVGDVYGVQIGYEIGDRSALNAIFGGIGYFPNVTTVSKSEFDSLDVQMAGTVDEIIGATGSLQSEFDREMAALGLESPPAWLMASDEAMVIFVNGVNEGWSAERIYGALSSTDAFKTRFKGIEVVKEQTGSTSWVDAVNEYVYREGEIRSSLLSARGPGTDTSQEYVSSLIGSGWNPTEVDQLLQLEKQVRANPQALQNINDILVYQGLDPLSADDFVSFLLEQNVSTLDPGYTPSDYFEAINDALRFQALLTEGVEISFELATELGTGTSDTIQSPEAFSRQAQLAASYLARNSRELNLDKMGLTREDVIAAMFGEVLTNGRPVSEVNAILEQFARERSAAAQGYTTIQSFLDKRGRPIMQGFADFS